MMAQSQKCARYSIGPMALQRVDPLLGNSHETTPVSAAAGSQITGLAARWWVTRTHSHEVGIFKASTVTTSCFT